MGRRDVPGFVCPCILDSSQHHPHEQLWKCGTHCKPNSTVLKCPFNGYNNHLTNNLEQALIASNVVLWLGCRKSRDMLTVTSPLWLYSTFRSVFTEQKGNMPFPPASFQWAWLGGALPTPRQLNRKHPEPAEEHETFSTQWAIKNHLIYRPRCRNVFPLLSSTAGDDVYKPTLFTTEKALNW